MAVLFMVGTVGTPGCWTVGTPGCWYLKINRVSLSFNGHLKFLCLGSKSPEFNILSWMWFEVALFIFWSVVYTFMWWKMFDMYSMYIMKADRKGKYKVFSIGGHFLRYPWSAILDWAWYWNFWYQTEESGVRHYIGYRNKLLYGIWYPTSKNS